MSIYVTVGNTVVGAFDFPGSKAAMNCIRSIAPGCRPQIKKCPPPSKQERTKYRSNEVRQTTNRPGSYTSVPMLKPGEFKL